MESKRAFTVDSPSVHASGIAEGDKSALGMGAGGGHSITSPSSSEAAIGSWYQLSLPFRSQRKPASTAPETASVRTLSACTRGALLPLKYPRISLSLTA